MLVQTVFILKPPEAMKQEVKMTFKKCKSVAQTQKQTYAKHMHNFGLRYNKQTDIMTYRLNWPGGHFSKSE